MSVVIVPMEPAHAARLERQSSQALTLGLVVEMDEAYGRDVVANPGFAWAAIDGDRVVALFGLLEVFIGVQATAWAVFADGIGPAHHVITRFCRARIREGRYARIEAIVKCSDAEQMVRNFPALDPGELLAVMTVPGLRTPAMRWAAAIGLTPAAVLRKYGAASETHMLFERIS